jgi:hypothetical protein
MAAQPKAKPKAGWFDMPSASKKQHNLMAMVAHDPAAAKRVGIPQSVGEEFVKADKGKKFGTGGRPDRQTINQPKTSHGKAALFAKGGHVMATKKMSSGGDTTMSNKSKERHGLTMEKMGKVTAGGKRPHGEHTVQEKGHTKARMPKMAGSTIGGGMKKGGMAKAKKK